MAPSRSTEIRRFFTTLGKTLGCTFDPVYEDRDKRWCVTWQDGPTAGKVRRSVDRNLKEYAELIGLSREYSDEATVLGALRAFTTGAIEQYTGLAQVKTWTLRDVGRGLLKDVADPLSAADERERHLVDHLLTITARTLSWGISRDADYALELLAERRGVGFLLTPDAAVEQPPVTLTPLERLTERYAQGVQAVDWRRRGATMSAGEAFAAVTADPEPTPEIARAALALIPAMRAELDTAEQRLTAVAVPADTPAQG
ncbi:hypothetical protein ACPC54_30325 [Kitasatospora sp. NPDC094028]